MRSLLDRAARAGLGPKDNWKKFPRAMLRSRCVAEGVRTVYPVASGGMLTPEELRDEVEAEPKDVTPQQEVIAAPVAQSVTLDQVLEAYSDASDIRTFNAARYMASLLPDAQKDARAADRATVARLKGQTEQRATEVPENGQ